MLKYIFLFLLIFSTLIYATKTRIMPVGDSITYDDAYRDHPELSGDPNTVPRPASKRHAYRNYLWYKLKDAHYSVNFVGSRNAGNAITPSFDPHNEGYPGETSHYIANIIYNKLKKNPADIILLHIGSNDHSESVSGVEDILDEIDRYEVNYNHHIKVILAQIIDRTYGADFTNGFNTHLKSLANQRKSDGDDIYLVDMQHDAGLHYDDRDFQDRTHPNNSGYTKMAAVWFKALKKFLPDTSLSKPTKFKASKITTTTVKLIWQDNSTGETMFKINDGDTPLKRVTKNIKTTTITNLKPNTTYHLNIRASTETKNSEMSYVTFTTLEDIPIRPSKYTASKITAHNITLHWQDNSNNELGFKIWDKKGKRIATLLANTTSTTIKNLQGNTTYTFEIRSYNSKGNSKPQYITFTTKDDYGWLPAVYHTILY